jgi:Ca2+-binding RTX toxin-like protein
VDRFLFADGSSLTADQISSLTVNGVRGTEGNDLLIGRLFSSNHISGLGGNDIITGGLYSDTLDGGTGRDQLLGGFGSDTYVFSKGDGTDTVTDIGISSSDTDTILFRNDVLKSTVALYQDKMGLVIGYGASDTVSVNFQYNSFIGVEKVQLASGEYLTNTDINRVIQSMSAFAVEHGIALTNINDVRNNQELMTIVANAWHG